MDSAVDKRKKLLHDCVNSLKSSAELIQRYSDATEKTRQIKFIQKMAQEYCDMESKLEQSQTACNLCAEHFSSEDADASEDVLDVYNRYLNDTVHAVIPFDENPIWKSINECIVSTQNRAVEEATSANNSLICSQQFQAPIDPLTKTAIVNPCKSTVCGHIFEYDTILAYIKMRQQSKYCRCPYVGCTNSKMQRNDLIQDLNLQERISQAASEDID